MWFMTLFAGPVWRSILTLLRIIVVIAGIITAFMTSGASLLIAIPLFLILGALRNRSYNNVERRMEKRMKKKGVDQVLEEVNDLNRLHNYLSAQNAQSQANFDKWYDRWQRDRIDQNLSEINSKLHYYTAQYLAK